MTNDLNLIIFPDWTQPEEFLTSELERVIRAIATHQERDRITLLSIPTIFQKRKPNCCCLRLQ
ncbi:MAG: hypothetical protein HC820_02110 [Hydrococcus sp. RM1_1_31]|nr:hypothetical protein [Hydrococcus sp. RM1_1_31]